MDRQTENGPSMEQGSKKSNSEQSATLIENEKLIVN